MALAHAVAFAGGLELELLIMGMTVLFLSFLFRPSSPSGSRTHFLVTLGVGTLLVLGAFLIPHL